MAIPFLVDEILDAEEVRRLERRDDALPLIFLTLKTGATRWGEVGE